MNNGQKIGLDKAILITGLVIYGTGFSLLYVIFAPLSREIGLLPLILPGLNINLNFVRRFAIL